MAGETLRYRRRPGVAWREEPEAVREALVALAQGRDAAEEGTLLLVDRGKVFELNLLGAEIWKLCDGTRGPAEIAAELLPRFDVSPAELEHDVREFLEDLRRRGWVVTA